MEQMAGNIIHTHLHIHKNEISFLNVVMLKRTWWDTRKKELTGTTKHDLIYSGAEEDRLI